MVNSAHNAVPRGDSPGLRREAGLLQLLAYGVGNIIGAGIYVLVGEASGLAGGTVWLAFMIGAAIAAFTGLSYAELAAMYPKAASEYVFLGRAYGSRLISFMTGWTMLSTEVVAAAAVAIGFAGYLRSLAGTPVVPVAAGLIIALAGLTLLGIRESLRVNLALSAVAVSGLIVVIALGLVRPTAGVDPGHLTFSGGADGLLAAAALVFFAYIGFDNIANLAEETKEPQRTLPRALILSVVVSTVLYVLVGLAVTALVPWHELAESDAPLALAASRALGDSAFNVLAVTAMLTTTNTVLVLMIVSSRMVYGMSREGVLPEVAGRLGKRSRSPYVATLAVAAAALCFLALGSAGSVAKVTSFGSLVTFALVNLAMLHLRRVAPRHERPFRAPVSIGWLSITGTLGLVSCVVMLTNFDWLSVLLGLVLPLSGAVVYWLQGRARPAPDGVPLHEPHERRQ
jgi:APA family basic amino acid/polyamine antiporter